MVPVPIGIHNNWALSDLIGCIASHLPFFPGGNCTCKLVSTSHPLTPHCLHMGSHPCINIHTPSQFLSALNGNNVWFTHPFPPMRALHPQAGINVTPTDSPLFHTNIYTPILTHSLHLLARAEPLL